jgi:hypothetical protein
VLHQLERKIKYVRSDKEGEYLSNDLSGPTHPNQMGLLNGKNRTLRDLVNAMLDCFGLSKSCWGEAILTAGIVLNRVSSSKGEITPYEAWKGRKPALGFLRACGCLAKVNAPACKK